MEKMNALEWVAFVLVIVGALNWGLYALSPKYDLVALISMGYNWFSRLIYGLVGLSALYMIYSAFSKSK